MELLNEICLVIPSFICIVFNYNFIMKRNLILAEGFDILILEGFYEWIIWN